MGLLLIIAGGIGLNSNQAFHTFGIMGGMTELIFSILIILINRNTFKQKGINWIIKISSGISFKAQVKLIDYIDDLFKILNTP